MESIGRGVFGSGHTVPRPECIPKRAGIGRNTNKGRKMLDELEYPVEDDDPAEEVEALIHDLEATGETERSARRIVRQMCYPVED